MKKGENMADNELNNELNNEYVDSSNYGDEGAYVSDNQAAATSIEKPIDNSKKLMLLKSCFIIVICVFILLGYKWFTKDSKLQESLRKNSHIALQIPKPKRIVATPQYSQIVNNTVSDSSVLSTEIQKKITLLESQANSYEQKITEVTQQISTINDTAQQLNAQITNLTGTISLLSTKLVEQNNYIAVVNKTVQKLVKANQALDGSHAAFYIQALIPGRAWLIKNDGTTLTVSKGSDIPGFGIVTNILPKEGRVELDTGKMIEFSQQDK